jgi:hypothetical protein
MSNVEQLPDRDAKRVQALRKWWAGMRAGDAGTVARAGALALPALVCCDRGKPVGKAKADKAALAKRVQEFIEPAGS